MLKKLRKRDLEKFRDRSSLPSPAGRLYGGTCGKYEETMKNNEGNIKKYEGNNYEEICFPI